MIKLEPIAQETLTYISGPALDYSITNYLNKRTEGMYPEDRSSFVPVKRTLEKFIRFRKGEQ